MKQEAFAHEELKVEFSENGDEAIIIEEFTYGVDDKNYVVPIGFVTDFASVPRFAQIIVPRIGKYTKATVIHDYWYKNATNTKKWADKEFLRAMLLLSTPKWQAYIMYMAVKLFGKGNY